MLKTQAWKNCCVQGSGGGGVGMGGLHVRSEDGEGG